VLLGILVIAIMWNMWRDRPLPAAESA